MLNLKRPIIAMGFCMTLALSGCGPDFFSALASGIGVDDKSDSVKVDSSDNSSDSNTSNSSNNTSSNSSNSSTTEPPPAPTSPDLSDSNTIVEEDTSAIAPGTTFNTPGPAGVATTQPAPAFLANFVPPGHQYFGPGDTGLTLGSGFAGTQLQANVGVLVTVDRQNRGHITLINTQTLKSFPTITPGGAPLTFESEVNNGRPFVPVFVDTIALLHMSFNHRVGPGQCDYYELNYDSNGQVYIATVSPTSSCFL